MKTTFGALAIAVSLIASAGAASAMPTIDSTADSDWVNVFEPKN